MSTNGFRIALIALASFFTIAFVVVVIPPLLKNPDILGAFAAGFVNPYASGYSLDVFTCWAVLAAWVVYEAKSKDIRHGWVALLLGVVPGVAVGFSVYLFLRLKQVPNG